MPRNLRVETQLRAIFRGFQGPEHDILAEDAARDRVQVREAAAAVAAQLLEEGEDTFDTIKGVKIMGPWSEDGGGRAEARLSLALGFSEVAEKFGEGQPGIFWPAIMAGLVLLLGDPLFRVQREAHAGLMLVVDGSGS